MLPIKLTLEGLTSFRQRTEIDFTGLDLFAITGPTGSGKTSIIDAITYSLYGQTARLGGKGLGELITQGASRLSVMLEFESGGKRYRIARVLKRSGPGSVRLEIMESDGDHAFDGGAREIATQITKIVGLDFDAFTKAVVLPQGKFDEFLRGDPAERREILEALLNLGVYREMMQRANARHKERQIERDLVTSQLQSEYADATEENRQVLADEIKKVSTEAALVNRELVRVEALRTPAIELRQKREMIGNSERDLKLAEERFTSEQKKVAKLVSELQQREKDFHQLEEELRQVPYNERVYQKLLALRPVAQQLEKTERERVAKVQENNKKSSELNALEKKLETARRSYKQTAEKSQTVKDGYDAAKEKFAALKKKYGSVEMVEDVAEEVEHMNELEQQLQRDQRGQAELEKKQTDLGGRIERLEMEEAQAKKLYSEAQDAYESIVRKHSAEDLRKHLKTGESCPVCDQVVTRLPKRLPTAKLDETKAAEQERQEAWHKKHQARAKAKADLAALPSQLESAKAHVARTSKQITETKRRAERILGKVPGVDGLTQLKLVATELRAAESACTSKDVEARKAADEETDAKDVVTRVERDLAVLTESIQSLKQQIEGAVTEIEQLCTQLKGVGDSKSIQAELGAQEKAKQKRTEIAEKMEDVQQAREQSRKQHGEVNAQMAGLKGKVDLLKATVEKAKSESAQIELRLDRKLAELELPRGKDEAEQIEQLLSHLHSQLQRVDPPDRAKAGAG